MKCADIEHLIPAWLENDLPPERQSMVAAHLEACRGCRELAEDLRVLETALEMRRVEVPPAVRTVAAVLAHTGRGRARAVLDFVIGGPCLSALSLLAAGGMLFAYRSGTEALFARNFRLYESLTLLSERLVGALVRLSGGDAWVLAGIYGGLTLLIVLASAWTVLNFARSRS